MRPRSSSGKDSSEEPSCGSRRGWVSGGGFIKLLPLPIKTFRSPDCL